MRDRTYEQLPYVLSELPHRYGPNVHLVGTPYLLSLLARLCAKETVQPEVNRLVGEIYGDLLKMVLNVELPRRSVSTPTRMIDFTPEGLYQGQVLDPEQRAVVVNIARAGTLPAMVTYELLNHILSPPLVRQDHLIMSRELDDEGRVTGSSIGGSKIGGDVDDALVLFPDPMGATGGSISKALNVYGRDVDGKMKRAVCIHLIVTPEYLRRISTDHPDAVVYAVRLDRGMSSPSILETVPGTHWDQERGLTETQYIVPGGGGLGEVMNNAYV